MRLLALVVTFLAGSEAVARPPIVVVERETSVVSRWNEVVLEAIKGERTPPPVAARNLAIVHVAVYDAVVSINPEYRAFYSGVRPQPGSDPTAAAAAAAHRVLVELYPKRVREFDSQLDSVLDEVPEGAAKTRGVAHGLAVAERVLKWRAADLATASRTSYKFTDEEGRWRPTPPKYADPLLPGWANAVGFAVADRKPFAPSGPPKLDSDAYAAALREVKSLGGTNSEARTKDQTEIARFWADGEGTVTPPGHWNRIAQAIATDRKLSLAETARLFALLNVSMADAALVCWECKYRFDVWRPVTALRETDPTWMPLLPTPPFPAYTSGHSSFSGSAAAALEAFFGTDRVSFTSTSDGLPGVSRAYTSFRTAAEEAGMSRIYGGIHWQFDNTDGLKCGREIAAHVTKNHFGKLSK